MNDLVIIDQHAERHAKAWQAFNQLYVMERPQPPAMRWWHGLPWLMLPFGIIAVCGIALSSFRTAPIFEEIAEALVGKELAAVEAALAVVVIEVTVVVIRYVMLLQRAEDGKHDTGELHNLMRQGFSLAFGVALAANIYGSIRDIALIQPIVAGLDLIVATLVGISAPVLAFIAGDILASLYLRSERRRNTLRAAYDEALRAWQDQRDEVWKARKGDYGLRLKVESLTPTPVQPVHSVHSLNSLTEQRTNEPEHVHAVNSANGYTKAMDARALVREFFRQHPDRLADKLDVLVEAVQQETGVKVGRTSIHNVRKEISGGAT